MWHVEEVFILSDLRLTTERGTGFFQADAELTDCLHWILSETRDSVTVLAGDTLDFLVIAEEDKQAGFTSLDQRTRRIVDHHPEVFEALAALAQSARHRLVIMGGDRDHELIFPTAQEVIERCLGLDFVNPAIRWLVQGEALRLRVGNAVVLIEHGNLLDPWNRINYPALQRALSLASYNLLDHLNKSDYQYPLPLGHRLALQVINALHNQYYWVDFLKPETEALLPLLWYFASSAQRGVILDLAQFHLSLKTSARYQQADAIERVERLYKGGKELSHSSKDQAFKEWDAAVWELQRLVPGRAGKRSNLIEKLRLISAQDTFFEIDKPDDSAPYLKPRFEAGADLIINGHTHSAKAYALDGGFYLNTGTWGQLTQLPKSTESDEVWQKFLDQLGANDIQSIRCPTLARVQQWERPGVTRAALLEWQQAGPKTLASYRFADRQTGWQMGN